MPHYSSPPLRARVFSEKIITDSVARAESLAERTIQTLSDPISLEEFQRLVTGTQSGRSKVVIGLYGRFRRSLNEGDQQRLDIARVIATGDANRQVWDKPIPRVEEYYLGRAKLLARQLSQSGELLTPSEYVHRVMGREIDTEHLTEYGGRIRSSMSIEGQLTWDRLFREATGRESGKAGLPALPYDQLVRAAQVFATSAQLSGRTLSIPEFQRGVLSITDRSVDDRTVSIRFSYARLKMSEVQRESVDRCMQVATGVYGGERGVVELPDRRLSNAKRLAADVVKSGQVMHPNDFGRAFMESDAETIAPMVSRWRARLSEKDRKAFDQDKAVATGKSGTTAGAGQVFAPDADQIDEQRASLAPKPGGFDVVTIRNEPLTTPAEGPEIELTLPGVSLPEDFNPTTEQILVLPDDDRKKWQTPPTVTRPYRPSADVHPMIALDPEMIGILVVAGLLIALDGPLPFGDAAAASLVGGRFALN